MDKILPHSPHEKPVPLTLISDWSCIQNCETTPFCYLSLWHFDSAALENEPFWLSQTSDMQPNSPTVVTADLARDLWQRLTSATWPGQVLELCPTGAPYTGHPVRSFGFFFFFSFSAVLGLFFFFFFFKWSYLSIFGCPGLRCCAWAFLCARVFL